MFYGPQPVHGYPDPIPPGAIEELGFRDETLTRAQKRLIRYAQEKVTEQVILHDKDRKRYGWQQMHVRLQQCAHECENLPRAAAWWWFLGARRGARENSTRLPHLEDEARALTPGRAAGRP